jgi:hypothetical protein
VHCQYGKIKGSKIFYIKMTLEVPSLGLVHRIDGHIALE